MKKFVAISFSLLLGAALFAQTPADRSEVRAGNRDFKKKNFKEAEIDYRRAIVKDSTSATANYNLANALYRKGEYKEARKFIDAAKDNSADTYFNRGDIALQEKDYQAAVDAFKNALLLDPSDVKAKENYIYAKQMLKNQQDQQQKNQQNQDNQDQNKDQNQDNQDQQKDKNKDKDKKDQNQDNQDNQDNRDQNQDKDNKDQDQDQNENGQGQMSPQTAQAMLEAIQEKEKQTKDKVDKQKALILQNSQVEKNW